MSEKHYEPIAIFEGLADKTKIISIVRSFVLLFVFILPLHVHSVISQDYWSIRYDLDRGNDYGQQIIETENSLVILTKAICDNNQRNCIGILSIDYSGQLLWRAVVYDSMETNYDEGMMVRNDTVIVNTNYYGIDDRNYALFFFDLNGNQVDRHDYYYPGLQNEHWARGIAGNSEHLFVNFRYREDMQNPPREVIRAYDREWNTLWENSVPNTFSNPLWCDTEATLDGGVVAAYTSRQGGGDDRRATIEKYDQDGELEWTTVLPHVYDEVLCCSWIKIDCSPDGGYVGLWVVDTFAVNYTSNPNLIFKLNSEGHIEWERISWFDEFFMHDVFSLRNGNIVACGSANEWFWDPEIENYSAGLIVCWNAQGDRLWERNIFEETGGATFYEFYGGTELANGDLVFTGIINDTIFGTIDDPTPTNTWVVKLDSVGCLIPGCDEWQHIISGFDEIQVEEQEFIAFPNPSSDFLKLGLRMEANIKQGNYKAVFYDMRGQVVSARNFNPFLVTEFDTRSFSSGSYVLAIFRDSFLTQSIQIRIE